MLGNNHTMELEVQGEIIGKELIQSHENSLMSPFLNRIFEGNCLKRGKSKILEFRNFVSTIPHLSFEMVEFEKHQDYSSTLNAFEYICKVKSLQDFQDILKS
ncbi:hypothetical protein M9H77_12191 [Catharanthus roseus]|uniref:Uncharacterized protein n=1 Tax=Catharanthus roseus TaxID=4058 RepID=A0ACC0BGQ6_CATRO|nr:hypothetical protein M9H77_12191 [Catharanthus roseus]